MNDVSILVGAEDQASRVMVSIGKASEQAGGTIEKSMGGASDAMEDAGKQTVTFGQRLGNVQDGAGKLAGAFASVGAAADTIGQAMSYGKRHAIEYARAQQDVNQAAQDVSQSLQDLEQATRDEAQASIDSNQAAVDMQQALLDQATAQKAYNDAVKKFGANSDEAKQASIDLAQAGVDVKQAQEDSKQATEDATQAQLDAQQAELDHTGATTDLAEAQGNLAAQSSGLKKVSDMSNLLAGGLGALVGIISAITAVQWLWNIAMDANPIGLIIIAIVALIAIIVLIATKTTWFQDLWSAIWGAIGDPIKAAIKWIGDAWSKFVDGLAAAVSWVKDMIIGYVKFMVDFWVGYFKFIFGIPGKVKDAFLAIGDYIYAPFKWAFNKIADGWNNTAGRLHFEVPSWVPGIGGRGFDVPNIPHLQRGGEILREGVAMVHKGERVLPAGTRGLFNDVSAQQGSGGITITFGGNVDGAFATAFMLLVRTGQITISPQAIQA